MVAASLAGSSTLRAAVLHTQLPYTQTLVALFPWLASVFAFTLLYKLAPAAANDSIYAAGESTPRICSYERFSSITTTT